MLDLLLCSYHSKKKDKKWLRKYFVTYEKKIGEIQISASINIVLLASNSIPSRTAHDCFNIITAALSGYNRLSGAEIHSSYIFVEKVCQPLE